MSQANAIQEPPSSKSQRFERMVYREFLLEPHLYLDEGLHRLPQQLADLLGCAPREALDRLTQSPDLEGVSIEQLRQLLKLDDAGLLSSTPESVAQQLQGPEASYDQCIRAALCYAVAKMEAHLFEALRAAAEKRDDWARHHFVYGLFHALDGNDERALWELEMALAREPYEDGRARIRDAIDLVNLE